MSLEKKSVSELKDILKQAGMTQAGDKGTLIYRIGLFNTAKEYKMEHEGTNICLLKTSSLQKAAAKHGVSPIGNNDEILTAFVAALKKAGKPQDKGPAGIIVRCPHDIPMTS